MQAKPVHRQKLSIVLLFLVSIVWGSTFFIIRDTVKTTDSFYIVFFRCSAASVLLFVYLLFNDRRRLWNSRAFRHGFVLGALLAITYLSQTIGLIYTTASHSAFITSIAVIIVPIALFLFYRKKFSGTEILSVFIVFTGLYLLTFKSGNNWNPGDLITMITAIASGLHIVFASRFVVKNDVPVIIFYQFVTASLFSLSLFAVTGFQTGNTNTGVIAILLYLGIIGTLFCYFASVWAQQYIDPVPVALIFSTEPVFASIFSYFTLGEIMIVKEIFGAMLILGGILIYQLYSTKKKGG